VPGGAGLALLFLRGFLDRDTLNLTAKFAKTFQNEMEFVSISNYMDLDKEYLEDGDAFPVPIVVFGQNAEIQQFTQEFRLSGATERMKWQVGAYYMDYQFDGNALTVGAPNIDLSFQLADAGIIAAPVVFAVFLAVGRKDVDTLARQPTPFEQRDHLLEMIQVAEVIDGGFRATVDEQGVGHACGIVRP